MHLNILNMLPLQMAIQGSLMNNMSTGNTMYDMVIGTLICSFVALLISTFKLSNLYKIYVKVVDTMNLFKNNKKIKLKIKVNEPINVFKALMHYVSSKTERLCTIKSLRTFDISQTIYDNKNRMFVTDRNHIYILEDGESVKIYDDIWITCRDQNETIENQFTKVVQKNNYIIITLESKIHNVTYIQDFIEMVEENYRDYLLKKSLSCQQYIEISYKKGITNSQNIQPGRVIIEKNKFTSPKTFDNTFFEDKQKVLNKINLFLNDKESYDRRGIPHTLGIMLYGEPGCGKTSFIKALMNLTGSHAIHINLTDEFDLNELRKILLGETIDDMVIPFDKRIIIFEEFDAVGDLVKDRDMKNEDSKSFSTIMERIRDNESTDNDDESSGTKDLKCKLYKCMNKFTKDNNNNLAFLLNILDGPIEMPGRIGIFTTNKIDTLDKALLRPGRIDCMVEFKKCNKEIALYKVINFYGIKDRKHIETIKTKIEENYIDYTLSPATVDNICSKFDNKAVYVDVNINNALDKIFAVAKENAESERECDIDTECAIQDEIISYEKSISYYRPERETKKRSAIDSNDDSDSEDDTMIFDQLRSTLRKSNKMAKEQKKQKRKDNEEEKKQRRELSTAVFANEMKGEILHKSESASESDTDTDDTSFDEEETESIVLDDNIQCSEMYTTKHHSTFGNLVSDD
jgi:hypothetical protein